MVLETSPRNQAQRREGDWLAPGLDIFVSGDREPIDRASGRGRDLRHMLSTQLTPIQHPTTNGEIVQPRVLQYDVQGDGEPLVLVPGGLTGWLSWIPHADRLSATRRTVRVQPIHNELGSAGRPGEPGYTAETERESLRLTLDRLGIEVADFAGWSGGGRALLEFVLAYPDRVRTLTLVEPAAYWFLEQLGEHGAEVDQANELIHRFSGQDVSEDDLAEFLRLAGLVQPGEDPRQHPLWDRWLPHRMALSWQSEELDRSGRSVDELVNIGCPVLLARGDVTTEMDKRVVDVLAEQLSNATVVELPGDHAAHIQSIDAFLEALENHLATA